MAGAEPVRIYAAGSLVAALGEVIAASGLPAGAIAPPTFGPAGLLRGRLEKGETADLFLSADLAGPRALASAGRGTVVPFARHRLCIYGRAGLELTPASLLGTLLAPTVRLATSTPGADPGGDYAFAVFARADAAHPGARAVLEGKALKLLGSPGAMVPIAGRSPTATVFLSDRADALLYYCSGQDATTREVPGLSVTELPPALAVTATYGMSVMSDNPDALRLAVFILSDRGQAVLAKHGLGRIADPS